MSRWNSWLCLRALPNFHVFRPCDAVETAAAWYKRPDQPADADGSGADPPEPGTHGRQQPGSAERRYVIDDCEGTPDAILIASGSEVELAVKAKGLLQEEGWKIRVVSMPCMDLFEEQSEEYKESVLPKAVRKRVAVEALSGFGWGKYTGLDGACVCMTGFGTSGPQAELFKHFGFTPEHVPRP